MASEDLPANGHGGPADPLPKKALRRGLRAARAAFVASLTADYRARLEADLAAVLVANIPPGLVAGYHAVGSEIGLRRFKRVVLFPRVVHGGALTFHAGSEASATLAFAGLGNIPEPALDASIGVPAIVLLPLLAVDTRGTRLGQGGGYYDRTLAALRARGPVLAVGVAWDMQRVDTLPADPWDAPLDALATPSGWSAFSRHPGS